MLTGIEIIDTEIIEGEVSDLEEELAHIQDQIRIYRDNVRHLENRAARAGGEAYLNIEDRNQLGLTRETLERKELEHDEIRQKLGNKRAESEKAREVETLWKQMTRALAQKQRDKALVIASRLRAFEPSLAKTIDSVLIRFYWQVAIETPSEDYTAYRKVWEAVEKICDEVDDNEGLRSARQRLASFFEERGEDKEDQGQFQSAAHFYHRALDKYETSNAWFEQQRVLEKLIRVYANLEVAEATLRYSDKRIEILGQYKRLREAEHCYFHALNICSDLPEESRRTYWEQKLTKSIIYYFDSLDDIAGLRRIVDYSERDGRPVIYELAFPLLEEVIERVKQPLRTAA